MEDDEGKKQHQRIIPNANGHVMIVVPDDAHAHALPASASAPPRDADGPDEESGDEEERTPAGATSSLWRAAVLALAALALAAAAYACLYAGGDDDAGAAWRLLEARRQEDGGDDEHPGGRTSFLLPLYPKPPRRGGDDWPQNSTLFPHSLAGNLFPEGYVQCSAGRCCKDSVPYSVVASSVPFAVVFSFYILSNKTGRVSKNLFFPCCLI